MGRKKLVRKAEPPSKRGIAWPRWTGFRGMTVRDWLDLLVVPLALVVISFLFTTQQDQRQQQIENQRAQEAQKIENQRAEAERELAEQRAQDEALQAYLSQMSSLLLEKDLRASAEESEVRSIARARTVTVLGRFDPSRKKAVMQFLIEAELVQSVAGKRKLIGRKPIIPLTDADLSNVNLTGALLFGADLSSADLSNADLSDADLQYTDLYFANLSNAELSANLEDAYLLSADLSDADLSNASLSNATLYRANLSDANLRGADLSGANLGDANLRGADLGVGSQVGVASAASLSDADLSDANLSDANLSDANLSDANLRGADLSGANLSQANLSGANLTTADLSGANLSGVDLSGANLTAADLSGANLSGAGLSGADLNYVNLNDVSGLTKEQREQATTLAGAIMPDGHYVTREFKPAFRFEVGAADWEWAAAETTDEIFIQPGPRGGQLIFTNPSHVFDPTNLSELKELPEPENTAEWVSWFQRHPNLDTSKPVPLSVGGASGQRIDVTYASAPENYPRDFCGVEPCVPLYPTSESALVSNDGPKDRFIILDVGAETVLIDVAASEDKFDEFLPKAQEVLDTVEWSESE